MSNVFLSIQVIVVKFVLTSRFLLCGQTVTGEVYPPSPQATVKAATGGAQWSVSVSVESSGGAGSKALQVRIFFFF